MGFVGFLKFAFKCFDLLAWPLFSLGCPLYASVRAIETNSTSDMRNLVAYWIVFSVISLFELAFVRLINWLPFWPHMKLLAICWLVVPHFNGACYVYERLLCPCLSLTVNPQVAIEYLIKPKEDPSLNAESFLSVAERYVKENGSEALEKLIDSKSKHTKPNPDVEEIKAVTNTENKETALFQPKFKEPTVAKDDIEVVELREKNPSAAENLFKPEVPNVTKENTTTGEVKEKNPAATPERVKCVDSNRTPTEKIIVGAEEIKEKTVAEAGGENTVPQVPASEKVQREWTCTLCQVTTTSETTLGFHLHGKKHMALLRALIASQQENKKSSAPKADDHEAKCTHSGDQTKQNNPNKQDGYEARNPNSGDGPKQNNPNKQEHHKAKKSNSGDGPNQSSTNKREGKVQVNQAAKPYMQANPKFWCSICHVQCNNEINLASHLKGKKHLSNIKNMIDSFGKGL